MYKYQRQTDDLQSELMVTSEKSRQTMQELAAKEEECVVNKVEFKALQERAKTYQQEVYNKVFRRRFVSSQRLIDFLELFMSVF